VLAYAIPAFGAALAASAGALRAKVPRPDWLAVACATLLGLVAAGWAASVHDSDVPGVDLAAGMLLAGFGWGFLPPYLYFLLGRALAEQRLALVLIWAATAVPLVFYYGAGVLLTLEVVNCPADSYECPI
jgi:hypothetical protein